MSILETLKKEQFAAGITPRTEESMAWLRKRAHNIRRVDRNALMKSSEVSLRDRQSIGKMFFWFYDPKHKETLPYYDSFPLGIIVGPAPGGFHALNLHYLPPLIRAQFLDALMEVASTKAYPENAKFNITYQMLKGVTRYSAFKPCFKHYLRNHVRSRFALIPQDEWERAAFLPAADWQKRNALSVYRETRKMLNS